MISAIYPLLMLIGTSIVTQRSVPESNPLAEIVSWYEGHIAKTKNARRIGRCSALVTGD